MCIHLTRKKKTEQAKEDRTDTSAYLTSGSCASRRDLLGGEGTTTAFSMILRLLGFCSAAKTKTKQNKTKQRASQTNGRRRRTNEGRKAAASDQRGRGLGCLLDDGGEVAQVERLHLALVLLHIPLPRRLVRRHPHRLRGRRHHLPLPPSSPDSASSMNEVGDQVCRTRRETEVDLD